MLNNSFEIKNLATVSRRKSNDVYNTIQNVKSEKSFIKQVPILPGRAFSSGFARREEDSPVERYQEDLFKKDLLYSRRVHHYETIPSLRPKGLKLQEIVHSLRPPYQAPKRSKFYQQPEKTMSRSFEQIVEYIKPFQEKKQPTNLNMSPSKSVRGVLKSCGLLKKLNQATGRNDASSDEDLNSSENTASHPDLSDDSHLEENNLSFDSIGDTEQEPHRSEIDQSSSQSDDLDKPENEEFLTCLLSKISAPPEPIQIFFTNETEENHSTDEREKETSSKDHAMNYSTRRNDRTLWETNFRENIHSGLTGDFHANSSHFASQRKNKTFNTTFYREELLLEVNNKQENSNSFSPNNDKNERNPLNVSPEGFINNPNAHEFIPKYPSATKHRRKISNYSDDEAVFSNDSSF